MIWSPGTPGLLVLPSGRIARGHATRRPRPQDAAPDLALHLSGRPPPPTPWPTRWVRWPDFRLPSDRDDARAAFAQAWEGSADRRVEVACGGGRGRTGTALACIAILDGVDSREAVTYVRTHYDRHAVETPWQRRYVCRFT